MLRYSRIAALLEIQDAIEDNNLTSDIVLVAASEILVIISSGDDLLGAWFEQNRL
jgi:hypothetical protein